MRNISFALTTNQARAHVKTVTRRLGWEDLTPGTDLRAVEKGMGLKKGEHPVEIAIIEVISVCREPLRILTDKYGYGRQEVILEGFPNMPPESFVEMFCRSHKGCTPESIVTRIEFGYLDSAPACPDCGAQEWGIGKDDVIRCARCDSVFLPTRRACKCKVAIAFIDHGDWLECSKCGGESRQ